MINRHESRYTCYICLRLWTTEIAAHVNSVNQKEPTHNKNFLTADNE